MMTAMIMTTTVLLTETMRMHTDNYIMKIMIILTTSTTTHTCGHAQDLLQLLTEGVDDDDEAADEVEGDKALDDGEGWSEGHSLQHVVPQLVAVHEVAARRHWEVQQHYHCTHRKTEGRE